MNAARPPLSLYVARKGAKAQELRTEYLAHAYACHDMAQCAEDARDKTALRTMALLWEALAQRASVPPPPIEDSMWRR